MCSGYAILGSLIITSAIKSIRFSPDTSGTHLGNPESRGIAHPPSDKRKGKKEYPVCATYQRRQSGQRNFDGSPRSPLHSSLYITIDHRLGFAPRFYRPSNPSRYFCQLYHWLSPGALVTRKQPGDIIRACPRKSIHSDPASFRTYTSRRVSRSEIRYWKTILVSDFNFECEFLEKSEVSARIFVQLRLAAARQGKDNVSVI